LLAAAARRAAVPGRPAPCPPRALDAFADHGLAGPPADRRRGPAHRQLVLEPEIAPPCAGAVGQIGIEGGRRGEAGMRDHGLPPEAVALVRRPACRPELCLA
jgi:hypothetical protein